MLLVFVVLDVGELTSSGAGDPTSSLSSLLECLFISWFSSVRMEKGNWSTSEVNGMADAFAYRSVIIPINLPLISKHHPRGEGHSRFSATSYARLVEKATGQQVSS